MTNGSPSHQPLFRTVLSHVFALILAEIVMLGFAWILSARGKAWLKNVFATWKNANEKTTSDTKIIDV